MARRAVQPQPRSFLYVSEPELAPFLDSAGEPDGGNILDSVTGITIGWPFSVSLERRGPGESSRDRPLAERVARAEEELQRHLGIGDLSAREGWVAGRADMDLAPVPRSDTVLFCGYAGRLLVVLGGSAGCLTGASTPQPGTGAYAYAIRAAIENDDSQDLGDDLAAAARRVCVLPRPMRFVAQVIRHGVLAGHPPHTEFLLATPLYVETVDRIAVARGTVRWFDQERGWGLITPDDSAGGPADAVAFDAAAIEQGPGGAAGPATLVAGQPVEFRCAAEPSATGQTTVRELPATPPGQDAANQGQPPATRPGAEPAGASRRGRRPLLAGLAAAAALLLAFAGYVLSGGFRGQGATGSLSSTNSAGPTDTATGQPAPSVTASGQRTAQASRPASSAITSPGTGTLAGPAVSAAGSIATPSGFDAFGSMAVSPDGKTIAATGVLSAKVCLWQVADLQAEPACLSDPGGGGSPGRLAFDPRDPGRLAVADYGNIDLWNITTRQAENIAEPDGASVADVTYTPDGTELVEGNDQGRIHVYDLAAHTWSRVSYRAPGAMADMPYVAVSPNGAYLAADDGNGDGYVWNLASGTLLGSFRNLSSAPVFSPDSGMLAVGVDHTGTRLWDVATRGFAGAPLAGDGTDPVAEAFSPNGKALAVLDGKYSNLYLWDVATRRVEGQVTAFSSVIGSTMLAFSPNGQTIAVAARYAQDLYLYKVRGSGAGT